MFTSLSCCRNCFSSESVTFLKHLHTYSIELHRPSPGTCSAQRLYSKAKTRKEVCGTVLKHFDSQYSEELGEQWRRARDILLDPESWQYGVLLNRFSDLTNLPQFLTELGYSSLFSQTPGDSHSSSALTRLQCWIHRDPFQLPAQGHQQGFLKQYYLLNAASLLPVLALNVRDGEKVLDLCAAPGGKSLAILQKATVGLLHCNEVDQHRFDWLWKTLESYVPVSVQHLITASRLDGRSIGNMTPGAYDKVLVDAPCSNDRSWLYTHNVQQGERLLEERARLPLLQKELLCSALQAVRPGGEVVYSTCTMSQKENQSVVEAVLASRDGVEHLDVPRELIQSLSDHFHFAHLHSAVGQLVMPLKGKSWGPMYVSRLRRIY